MRAILGRKKRITFNSLTFLGLPGIIFVKATSFYTFASIKQTLKHLHL